MAFRLVFQREAIAQLEALKRDQVKLKRVHKCLRLLEIDPRYPGLNSHKMATFVTSDGREVWESYVENRTPSAWRVFWAYGPNADEITIVAILSHL